MNPPTFSLAALDMAGTTIEEHGAVYAALRDAVEASIQKPVPDSTLAKWSGTSKREAVAGMLTAMTGSAPESRVADVYADFTRRLDRAYAQNPPTPIPGVPEAIATMRAAGVKVVLQTGYSVDIAESILRGVGWEVGRDIDALVSSDEVAASRPAPYLIFHAMERVGVTSVHEVLVAGDTANDLGAGTNAGARFVVGVLTGAYDQEQLSAHPHTHLFASAAALPDLLSSR